MHIARAKLLAEQIALLAEETGKEIVFSAVDGYTMAKIGDVKIYRYSNEKEFSMRVIDGGYAE